MNELKLYWNEDTQELIKDVVLIDKNKNKSHGLFRLRFDKGMPIEFFVNDPAHPEKPALAQVNMDYIIGLQKFSSYHTVWDVFAGFDEWQI